MNRRTAVGVLGSLAFGTVATAWGRRALAQPVCTLTPEQIEGPFYLDQARVREDISQAKPGVSLRRALPVRRADSASAADRRPVLPGPGSRSRRHLRGQARCAATARSPRARGLRVLRADPGSRR